MKKCSVRKSNFIVTILLLIFSLFLIGEVSATTYYVCNTGSTCGTGWSTGNDTNSGTSKSTPFKTIQKGADVASAGDTVIVGNGTYTNYNSRGGFPVNVYLNRQGTSGSWITIKAENKWGAQINGNGNVRMCVLFDYAGPAAYVNFEGFEVTNCCSTSTKDGDALFINAEDPFPGCVNQKAHHIRLYKLKVHDNCPIQTNQPYGMAGIDGDPCTGPVTIDSCVFYNIGRLNPYTVPSAPQSSCTDATGNVRCYNHDAGIYTRGSDYTITNNIFYPKFVSGWPMQPYALWTDISNLKIVNNTFYGSNPQRDYHILLASYGYAYDNVLIQNNIFHSPRNYALDTANSTNVTVRNNLVYGASLIRGTGCSDPAYTCSGNITGQDPKFLDSGNHNFHLQSGSPAIDKGLAFSGRTKDADGNSIVGAPDIGAYEAGGVTEDTIPPAPPAIIEVR